MVKLHAALAARGNPPAYAAPFVKQNGGLPCLCQTPRTGQSRHSSPDNHNHTNTLYNFRAMF